MCCQIYWPIFVAAEIKLNMHHCGNVDSIDIARGIQSVVFCRRNFLSTRKIIYIHCLKSISPVLTESTVLFLFSPLLLLPSLFEVGFLIPEEWEHSVGRLHCVCTCGCWLWLATLMPSPLHPIGEGFCPWKSVTLISDCQTVISAQPAI